MFNASYFYHLTSPDAAANSSTKSSPRNTDNSNNKPAEKVKKPLIKPDKTPTEWGNDSTVLEDSLDGE